MIEQTIPSVPAYTGVIPDKSTQSEIEFANNVYPFHVFYNSEWIASVGNMATALEEYRLQANSLQVDINGVRLTTLGYKNDALDYKDTALVYRNEAIQAKQAIDGYVVPTNATYTPGQIDALNNTQDLENFLNFKF